MPAIRGWRALKRERRRVPGLSPPLCSSLPAPLLPNLATHAASLSHPSSAQERARPPSTGPLFLLRFSRGPSPAASPQPAAAAAMAAAVSQCRAMAGARAMSLCPVGARPAGRLGGASNGARVFMRRKDSYMVEVGAAPRRQAGGTHCAAPAGRERRPVRRPRRRHGGPNRRRPTHRRRAPHRAGVPRRRRPAHCSDDDASYMWRRPPPAPGRGRRGGRRISVCCLCSPFISLSLFPPSQPRGRPRRLSGRRCH